jgi:lipoprotein-releasing system permease protein
MPFEWFVALRYLRDARGQTVLILSGVAVGVSVVVFLSALIGGLQTSLIKKTLGSQPHVTLRVPTEAPRPLVEPTATRAVARRIETAPQRLRSIDQWQALEPVLDAMPGITAVSPMVSGPAFALRGDASKSIAIFGVDPARYDRIVAVGEKLVGGAFRLGPDDAVIGKELAKDLGLAVGDRFHADAETDSPVTQTSSSPASSTWASAT